MKVKTPFKSGYASLIGRPNVGKSTLLNRLVAQKIAAMSAKPQTTRNKITGVVHLPGGQIILVDTPGIHQSTTKLNQAMVKASLSTYGDVDLILLLVDASKGFSPEDEYVLESMRGVETPKILIINKIDLVAKPELLGLIQRMHETAAFMEIIPISALKRDGLELLITLILKYLPDGPQYFPESMITDSPEEFLIAEIIREKIINQTHFEVPYSVAVVVEQVEETEKGGLVIDATVYAEKASQKKILIGEKGSMLKKVGSLARKEIEKRFAVKVYLNLFVKVKTHWREDERYIKEFGYLHD
ncbi:MAG: GTPase Era [Nitrospinaceae bacterium]|nr:MAG: GTPase Era [Nitrospinaceae bacterium]